MSSNTSVSRVRHYKGDQGSNCLVAKLGDFKKDIKDFYSMGVKTRVIDQIESLTQKYAAKIAIDAESTKLSYQEYFHKASALSALLKSFDITIKDKVVVFVDPSEHIPIALLSIFMIGATYVPIDTSWPKSRIDAILEDISPKAILTVSDYHQRFTHLKGVKIINMDTPNNVPNSPKNFKISYPNLANTAVIFYTSGSTGMPKGVQLSYKNIESYIESASETYRFNASDVHLSIAKYSFSISLFDLLLPFYCGGTLKLKTRDRLLDPESLGGLVTESTCFHMGPALLESLVRFSEDNAFSYPNIQHVSSGGDMIPATLLERCKLVFPNAEIWVIYGCTEIACMGTTWQVSREAITNTTYVGKPFSHSDVVILSNDLQPTPAGEIGEIYFAGEGVTTGYLNREELNKTEFITFNDKRFYATGDHGVFNEDGNLQLKGRKDFQIKINGIRIETEEVEFWLNQMDGVENSVVIGAKDVNGDLKIISFAIKEPDSPPLSEIELKQQLAAALPDYMVPNKIYFIESMPLNTNGKLDRNALIAAAENNLANNKSGIDERDEIANRLMKIWFNAGASGTVSENSNFFDLGGDSLGVVQLIYKLGADFDLKCDFEFIYAHPKFSDQLFAIKKGVIAEEVKPKSMVVPLDNKGTKAKKKFYVTPGLGGHIVSFHNFGTLFSDDISAHGLLYPNYDDEVYDTITDVAEKLVKDILEFQKEGPYYLCGHSSGCIINIEIARILKSMNKKAFLILIEARAFNKAKRKPLRNVLTIYLRNKPRLYLEKLLNAKTKLYMYVGNTLDSSNRARLKESLTLPKLKGAFSLTKKQENNYKFKECDVESILIKSKSSIWWDELRTWPSDYGLGEFVNIVSTSYSKGDHVTIVMDKANHAELAAVIESEISKFSN